MVDFAISIQHIGKRYRLGEHVGPKVQYDTLRDALGSWLDKPLRAFTAMRPEPPANPEPQARRIYSTDDYIWALNDVSFDVIRGEAVGIIGHNGAGKSTLLKVLSRITEPTQGRAEIYGRVSSLLALGAGFHPELTGYENVYLNGAILGMTKREIDRKFDDIIAFSEVEKFINTPVKRFSKGMRMRLGFSVAAHLDPEILIVDEVLAVGDIPFRAKCMDKMAEVNARGTTILITSHSMARIKLLCTRALLFREGKLVADGPAEEITELYMTVDAGGRADASDDADDLALAAAASKPSPQKEPAPNQQPTRHKQPATEPEPASVPPAEREWTNLDEAPGDDVVRLRAARVKNHNGASTGVVGIREDFRLEMEYDILKPGEFLHPLFRLQDEKGDVIFITIDSQSHWHSSKRRIGRYRSAVKIPGNLLSPGCIRVWASVYTFEPLIKRARAADAVAFTVVEDSGGVTSRANYRGPLIGAVRPLLDWDTTLTTDQ